MLNKDGLKIALLSAFFCCSSAQAAEAEDPLGDLKKKADICVQELFSEGLRKKHFESYADPKNRIDNFHPDFQLEAYKAYLHCINEGAEIILPTFEIKT